MVKSIKVFMKRILLLTMILMTVMFCAIDPYVKAATKLPAEGEFYYAGTTKGTYTVKDNIFEWLLNNLGAIVDWILGLITMAFRMSFVGWGTIFEWTLTNVLESSNGATYLDEALDATNVASANDSSQNVTVESIVYNNVPLFNINFFDFTVDMTKTGTGRDLTKLQCDKCDLFYEECTCTEDECKCTCCKTRRAMAQATSNPEYKTVVILIKETVAEWYYIIQYIAVAAMVVVLIVIGIKMAISTLASEKAVYKRMLVDWVVGIIFLFSIQYVMLFIINLNEIAVKAIKDYAQSDAAIATQVTKKEFGEDEKTNEDLEIGVYEAARTRAYDPKFINGTTGTVLYLTLVIFAWRFSWMYIKRYFTLIVLTLMAPGVAFSYALQKVFSGKAKSWSTWLNEYIVNVFIQTIHAIIYASFVSMALYVSLDSIAGMIVAFILMNFMLKADKIFRKIFKMSSDGSLLDRVSKGAEEARLDKLAKSAQSAVAGAKPALSAAAKSPAGKAIKAATQGAAAGAVMAIAENRRLAKEEEKQNLEAAVEQDFRDTIGEDNYKALTDLSGLSDEDKKATRLAYKQAKEDYMNAIINHKDSTDLRDFVAATDPDNRAAYAQQLAQAEYQALSRAMKAKERGRNAEDLFAEYRELNKRRKKFEKYSKRIGGKSAADRLFDYDKYFDKDGNRRVAYVYNPETDSVEKRGSRALVAENLNMNAIFGMTDEDTKKFQAALKAGVSRSIIAPVAMFAGLGSVVASPAVGLSLMAYGAKTHMSGVKRNRNVRTPKHRSSYANKNYSGLEFSGGAVSGMKAIIDSEIHQEFDQAFAQSLEITAQEKRGKKNNRNADTESVQSIVDAMYNNGSALDTRSIFTKDVEAILDSTMGGMSEEMDAYAEQENTRLLKSIATYQTDAENVKARAIEIDVLREYAKVDELQANEDKDKQAQTVMVNGDDRIVFEVASKVDVMVQQVVKDMKIDPEAGSSLTKEQKAEIADRVIKMAEKQGFDMKTFYAQVGGKDKNLDTSSEEFRAKLTEVVDARVDTSISKIKVDKEIVRKRQSLDISKPEDVEKYEITREEKAAVAEVIKEQIKADPKIKSVEDLQKNIEVLSKQYEAATGLSSEEATIQVKVFISQLSTEKTVKGVVKQQLREVERAGGIKGFSAKSDASKKSIIDAAAEEASNHGAEADPAYAEQQHKIVSDLLTSLEAVRREDERVYARYGKKTGDKTDYRQYVKFGGSDKFQQMKAASKAGKTQDLGVGKDPVSYGPLIGIESIINKL